MDIRLGSIDLVKDYVNTVNRIEGDVFLSSGRYVIDAKSIMGIFSLDLSKPLHLEIDEWKDEYMEWLKSYTVKRWCKSNVC